jgi:hypothetical protein
LSVQRSRLIPLLVLTHLVALHACLRAASRSMQGGGSELLGIVQLPLAGLQERLLRMVGPSSGTAAEFGGNPRKERYPDIAMDTNRPIVNPIDARECGEESLHLPPTAA